MLYMPNILMVSTDNEDKSNSYYNNETLWTFKWTEIDTSGNETILNEIPSVNCAQYFNETDQLSAEEKVVALGELAHPDQLCPNATSFKL